MPYDNMMQGRMPMQYTPDQPASADMIEARKLLEAGVAPHVVQKMMEYGLFGAASGSIGGGIAGGVPGALVMGGIAGGAGMALGAPVGLLNGLVEGNRARLTSQMPPMPRYPAQPGLEQQMPPVPDYMQGPPSLNALNRYK